MLDVTIVGGGASGLLVAAHLLRIGSAGMRLALVARGDRLGEGIAYSTARAEHLLNVTAGRMSAYVDDPDHFVRYLTSAATGNLDAAECASRFAPRREYARYLRAVFDEARSRSRASIEIIHDQAVAIRNDDAIEMQLKSGRSLTSTTAVLALGNWPRSSTNAAAVPDGCVIAGWNFEAVAEIRSDADVVIAGSGLSMVDAVQTLAANGHAGRIHVLSRHALLPLPHAPHGHLEIDLDALARLPLRHRMRLLRQRARQAQALGMPWQWLMDTLRPNNVGLWQTLGEADQRRFLRHVARYWDVHRHRIPPAVAASLEALRASAQLQVHKGRLGEIGWCDGRLHLRIRSSEQGTEDVLRVDRLIDCTGLQSDIRRVADPLLNSMLADGLIRPGCHGIGIDTTADGALVARNGLGNAHLYTLGSARIGQLWESVAVPELRLQAAALAQRIVERLGQR